MYICIIIITNYLHINVNYHTKPLARKSLVFVYQPIKCCMIFLLLFHIILSSFHFIFIFLFFYNFSLFLFMFLSMCFMLNFLYVLLDVSFVSFLFLFLFFGLYSYYLCSSIVHLWGFYAFCSTLVAQLHKTFSIF
jgi:hypothetical protein